MRVGRRHDAPELPVPHDEVGDEGELGDVRAVVAQVVRDVDDHAERGDEQRDERGVVDELEEAAPTGAPGACDCGGGVRHDPPQELEGEVTSLFDQTRLELTEELTEILKMAYERRRQLHLAALSAGRVQPADEVDEVSRMSFRSPSAAAMK